MANPHRGSVALQAGDTAYSLSFSINAICELEDAMGKPVAQIAEDLRDEANVRMSTIRKVVWAALLDHHDLDLKEAGTVATDAGLPACMEAVGKAFALTFPEAKGKTNPRKAARGS